MASIRTKTILGVAFIELILLVILITSILRFIDATNRAALAEYIETSSQLFLTTAKDAIIGYDLATLETYVKELVRNGKIDHATITDTTGTVLAKAGDSNKQTTYSITNSYTVAQNDIPYGHIRIGFDSSHVHDLLMQALRITASIAVIELLLVAFFSWLLGRFITKDILSLHEAVERVAAGDFDASVKQRSNDEVGMLAKSFNAMIASLAAARADRDKSQEALETLNKTLEARVERRTAELHKKNQALEVTNQKLTMAQKQLVQSEKLASIGQLAAGVAHEINNPIGFVTGNLETLDEYTGVFRRIVEHLNYQSPKNKLDTQQLETINAIMQEEDMTFIIEDLDELLDSTKSGLGRVKEIVSHMREFSRLDEASDYKAVDINQCVQSSLEMARNQIKYHCDVEEDYQAKTLIQANANQISQVVLNLLVNAGQAISEHGIIRLSTYEDNTWVYCEIADNGSGIEQSVIERIFDPFFTTKPVGEGTGLGLSISHGIIEAHGGKMSVVSAPGEGTTFTLMLKKASNT